MEEEKKRYGRIKQKPPKSKRFKHQKSLYLQRQRQRETQKNALKNQKQSAENLSFLFLSFCVCRNLAHSEGAAQLRDSLRAIYIGERGRQPLRGICTLSYQDLKMVLLISQRTYMLGRQQDPVLD